MKKALRTIRVLLDRHYLGNSINAFVVALAITAGFYAVYFGIVIGIQGFFFHGATSFFWDDRWVTASVIFDFFALGLLSRYWTPARVVRFWLREIHEVAAPYWFAWTRGRRVPALSPIIGLAVICTVAIALGIKLDRRTQPKQKASTNGVRPMPVEELRAVPCLTLTAMPEMPENK